MRAARMHNYKQPLVLEDVKVPDMAVAFNEFWRRVKP